MLQLSDFPVLGAPPVKGPVFASLPHLCQNYRALVAIDTCSVSSS